MTELKITPAGDDESDKCDSILSDVESDLVVQHEERFKHYHFRLEKIESAYVGKNDFDPLRIEIAKLREEVARLSVFQTKVATISNIAVFIFGLCSGRLWEFFTGTKK